MLQKKYDWPVTIFLISIPVVSLISVPIYLYFMGWNWATWTFGLLFAIATNMSITAGYHRLFAHRSYDAHPLVRLWYILIGSSAWQGSALQWCSGHRIHHKHVDTQQDPYNIKKGFWWAHMGWMFFESEAKKSNAPDLAKDQVIAFQHKHYIPIAIAMSFFFPAFVALLWNDPIGGFFVAGWLRVGLTQQSTWFVNSLCHTLGRRPYSEDVTARDSFIVAVLTHGEGYHNYHHRFEGDYRNGIKWWQWDPTKWMIYCLSKMGLVSRLRRMSNVEILKARLQVEALALESKGFSQARLDQLRERILAAALRLRTLKNEYGAAYGVRLAQLKTEIELTRIEFRYALKQWHAILRASVVVEV